MSYRIHRNSEESLADFYARRKEHGRDPAQYADGYNNRQYYNPVYPPGSPPPTPPGPHYPKDLLRRPDWKAYLTPEQQQALDTEMARYRAMWAANNQNGPSPSNIAAIINAAKKEGL